jgi:peptidoglycan/xylan/chitin deacetylase (PgdA/CDA1 family)
VTWPGAVTQRISPVVTSGSVVALAGHLLPALTSVAPLRRALLPRLSGISNRHHIALTFDDGPDRCSTPHFLTLLADRGVSATFFLLGAYARREPALVREMAEAGHELAVHGWEHDCLTFLPPGRLAGQLIRSREVIEDISGTRVRWYRPPYGVMTGEGLYAARRAGLTTVLWSSWGMDWSEHATPVTIVSTVSRSIRPGGTVLLHDTDRTAAPGSWRRTLSAATFLLDLWAGREVVVGPLRQHW